jgi:hypothetical protein
LTYTDYGEIETKLLQLIRKQTYTFSKPRGEKESKSPYIVEVSYSVEENLNQFIKK